MVQGFGRFNVLRGGEVIGMQIHGIRFMNLSRADQRPVFDLNDWKTHP